ncbi:hypothetical protein ACSBM8_06795 [Sphingomonas sp. ASY06-1R]|uniref:hypothetical protein n=1 Tax=Sphingomonas sp. ASY06-1R TaxID=3445771 RepID=UPI003FA3402D
MREAAGYIRRETRVSMAINAALSLAFYLLFFGLGGPVPIGGLGGFAFDFIPQSFAITLMSVLVPGLLTARKLAAGKLAPQPGKSALPRSLWLRGLLMASLAALVGAAGGGVLMLACGSAWIAWPAGAAIKIVYGLLLARIVTPLGLIAALRRSVVTPQPRPQAMKG